MDCFDIHKNTGNYLHLSSPLGRKTQNKETDKDIMPITSRISEALLNIHGDTNHSLFYEKQ